MESNPHAVVISLFVMLRTYKVVSLTLENQGRCVQLWS